MPSIGYFVRGKRASQECEGCSRPRPSILSSRQTNEYLKRINDQRAKEWMVDGLRICPRCCGAGHIGGDWITIAELTTGTVYSNKTADAEALLKLRLSYIGVPLAERSEWLRVYSNRTWTRKCSSCNGMKGYYTGILIPCYMCTSIGDLDPITAAGTCAYCEDGSIRSWQRCRQCDGSGRQAVHETANSGDIRQKVDPSWEVTMQSGIECYKDTLNGGFWIPFEDSSKGQLTRSQALGRTLDSSSYLSGIFNFAASQVNDCLRPRLKPMVKDQMIRFVMEDAVLSREAAERGIDAFLNQDQHSLQEAAIEFALNGGRQLHVKRYRFQKHIISEQSDISGTNFDVYIGVKESKDEMNWV